MPITIHSEKKLFHLFGKTFSYVLYVDEKGNLLNLYWGRKLPDGDVTYILKEFRGGASFDSEYSRLPFELPTVGTGYFGMPAVRARNEQGNDVTVLTYDSCAQVSGKPALSGLPAVYAEADGEASSLVIVLRDALTGLIARLKYTVMENLDVLTRSVELENGGSENLNLTNMLSASVPLPGNEYDILHLKGGWARERRIVRRPIGEATTRVESRRGASGHEENPFMAVLTPDTTESQGEVFAMLLIYSGSFLAATEVSNFENSRLSIGLNPDVCSWLLAPGETFQTPEALLVHSAEGLTGMSRRFHETIRTRVCRGYWRDRERPVLANNWEATYFDFTEEKLMAIVDEARKIGVELFVLDDGWFGKRNRDNCSLGDWVCNMEKLPCGIGGLAKRVNDAGLRFGLWFEPEMISPDSDLYRAHPDWCLHVDGRARTEARQQLILDLSRKDVQDYLIGALSDVLSNASIDYVKWDMNRNMTEYFSGAQLPERQNETQHRYMLGLYRVMEEITSRFPKVLFEGCSGGGGRFDAGMLYYMPQFWTSDDTDPVERLCIQYGTSLVYPPCTMGAHVSASPNHQTGRATAFKTRCDVALGGNFGFELDLSKQTPEDLATAKEAVELVKEVRKTLQQGQYTRLENPFTGNFAAWQFVSSDEREVVLCAYQRLTMPNAIAHRVRMTGLDENARYVDQETGETYSGAALMYVGLPVGYLRGDFTSRIIRLKKA